MIIKRYSCLYLHKDIDLLCNNCPQIMKFWQEYFTAGRQGKCFLFSSWISICSKRTCKNFDNWSKTNVFMSKMNFEKGFCISRGDNP